MYRRTFSDTCQFLIGNVRQDFAVDAVDAVDTVSIPHR